MAYRSNSLDMLGYIETGMGRMHPGAVSCLSFTDEQLIVSGSSLGSISISDLSSDQQVAALDTTSSGGFSDKTCYLDSFIWRHKNSLFEPELVFVICWIKYRLCILLGPKNIEKDYGTRVSPNVLYSMHHLRNDKSTLVVGGIDGVLRIIDQNSGEVLSRCIMQDNRNVSNHSTDKNRVVEKKKAIRLSEDDRIDLMPNRPPITCLAVGMQKVVTTHNDKHIRVWKFSCK
ncbi:UNVERIFIED_CONTAM: F-box/WD-40 repeat-containing protein [Sesamum calycinum]|uniref:F-box/WD-40 repeat-containing protein n=1 Tax=Sesamum calycinum TaxID=2727403 RepID=A0AAW2RAX1_9LAMI